MGRKHRRRPGPSTFDIERLSYGGAQKVTKSGREWFVREIPAHRAEKEYRCPDCHRMILPGEAHVVVWSADHFLGDAAAVSDRRHWHRHCWNMA